MTEDRKVEVMSLELVRQFGRRATSLNQRRPTWHVWLRENEVVRQTCSAGNCATEYE